MAIWDDIAATAKKMGDALDSVLRDVPFRSFNGQTEAASCVGSEPGRLRGVHQVLAVASPVINQQLHAHLDFSHSTKDALPTGKSPTGHPFHPPNVAVRANKWSEPQVEFPEAKRGTVTFRATKGELWAIKGSDDPRRFPIPTRLVIPFDYLTLEFAFALDVAAIRREEIREKDPLTEELLAAAGGGSFSAHRLAMRITERPCFRPLQSKLGDGNEQATTLVEHWRHGIDDLVLCTAATGPEEAGQGHFAATGISMVGAPEGLHYVMMTHGEDFPATTIQAESFIPQGAHAALVVAASQFTVPIIEQGILQSTARSLGVAADFAYGGNGSWELRSAIGHDGRKVGSVGVNDIYETRRQLTKAVAEVRNVPGGIQLHLLVSTLFEQIVWFRPGGAPQVAAHIRSQGASKMQLSLSVDENGRLTSARSVEQPEPMVAVGQHPMAEVINWFDSDGAKAMCAVAQHVALATQERHQSAMETSIAGLSAMRGRMAFPGGKTFDFTGMYLDDQLNLVMPATLESSP